VRKWRATNLLAFSSGVPHASPNPFNDQTAFEFRYSAEDRENQLSGWRAGVELL
jgi:hypothetical protein